MKENEKKELKKAIRLTYRIIGRRSRRNIEDKLYEYNEWFVPYTGAELEKMPFFNEMSDEFKVLMRESKDENFDFLSGDNCRLVSDEMILPNTANILMDAVYCVYDSFWEEGDDFFWMLRWRLEGLGIWRHYYYYVGLYTELIKYEVVEIKNLISVLVRLIGVLNDNNEPLVRSVFEQIKKMFLFNININESESRTINASMTECLFNLCSYKTQQTPTSNFTIEIDFTDVNRFMSLLSKYKNLAPPKVDYLYGNPCFCLAREGVDWFFSLSGYSKNCDNLASAIKQDLESFFCGRIFTYCKLCDDMLSYGYKDVNGKFVAFKKPVRHADRDILQFTEKEIKWQYSCCERKIFCKTQRNSESLFIYCKYMPCSRCVPAVREQKKQRYGDLYFFAFVKDFKSIQKLMKREARLLLKGGGTYLLFP